MANRRPLTLNPGGYQEYFQSGDTLQVDGSISINGASFTSVVPLTITGPGESNLGAAAIVGTFKADEITVDANTGDTVVITLGSDGNISASGRVEATSIDINSSTVIDGVLDEDTLVSDSETKLATQQSIKAYVDAITKTVRFAADTGNGTIEAGDNITDTVTIAGTVNEIETSVSGDTITLTLASTVVLDVVQVNSLQINGSTTVDGILDEDDFASDSATKLATQQSIKAFSENYTDTQIAAIPNATQSVRGFQSPADKTKLDNIEAGATADQTGAEIKALYEVEPNAYTDTKDTKLAGIEAGATADQTAAEIRALVDSASDSNVFTDADHTKLDGIEDSATADQTGAEIKALYEAEPSAFTDAQFTKLAGIEDAATADQTGAEIKALYEAEPSAFTDAQFTKLAGIEAGATADQTDAEIRAAVEAATDSNVFTDADHTKLDAIEAGAEVNVPHDLSYTASTRTLDITNSTGTTLPEATTTEAGLQSAADKTKLDGIEAGATADQTAAEIRSLVDSANDSNVFTDSDHTKLDGIEAGAEVNLAHDLSYTPSTREIAITNGTNITLPLATSGGDAGLLAGSDQTQLDSLVTNLAGKADLVGGKLSVNQVPDIAITEFLGNVASQSALTTLSGQKGDWATVSSQGIVYIITANDGSTASDWTALEYPASMANLSYNSATRTVISDGGTDAVLPEVVSGGISGLMTGAQASKLDGIETAATADQTAAEIRTLVESATDSNVFTDADHTKLNAIEAGAEVNVPTDLTYDAATRTVESSTGANAVIPHVVSSGNSGLISGADKAKLDGIEAGATADQTKADIDALNIDADTVDGIEAASFLRSDADDTFTGTLTATLDSDPVLELTGSGPNIIRFFGVDDTGIDLVYRSSPNTLGFEKSVDGTHLWETDVDTGVTRFSFTPNVNGNNVLTTANEGAGNGLNADTVDGLEAASFLRSDADDTFTGVITGNTLHLGSSQIQNSGAKLQVNGFMRTGNINLHQGGNNPTSTSLVLSNNVGSLEWDSNTVWHAGNDGAGSGLNADTVDGIQAASFLRSDADDSFSGNLTNAGNNYITFGPNTTWSKSLRIGGNGYQGDANTANIATTDGNLHLDASTSQRLLLNYYSGTNGVGFGNGNSATVAVMGPDGDLWKGSSDNNGSKYWHAGNDGSGSGLDADLLDGIDSGSFLRSDADDNTTGKLLIGGTYSNNSYNSVSSTRLLFGGGNDQENYHVGTNLENYGGNYTKLDLRWHTGIRMGAQAQYGGTRIFNSEDLGTLLFSVGKGDGNTRVESGNLYIQGNEAFHAGTRAISLNNGASGSTGNEITVGNSTPQQILRDTNLRPIIQATGQYPCISLNHTVTGNTNHGPVIQFAHDGYDSNEQIVVGTTGQGQYLDVGFSGGGYGDNSNRNPNNGISGYKGKTPVRIFNNGVVVGDTGAYPNHITSTSNALEVRGSTELFGVLTVNSSSTGSAAYGWIKGHPNNNHFHTIRADVTGTTTAPTVTAGHYQNFVEYLNTDSTAFKFKRSDTGTYTDVCTITRVGLTHVGDITAFSDIRLKENIEVIPNALEKVCTLRGVTYNRTDLTNKNRQSGVIAQEVEKVLPEVVQTNEEGIKSVAYGNLVGLLIESIKELKARVEELENN